MSAPAIELRGIVVRAGREPILGPVDLIVEQGEHVLVVGPSGSGKTTLLRAVAGLSVPGEGTVSLFGEPSSDSGKLLVGPEKRRVGYLFQGGGLWPHMSVGRSLRFVLENAGVPVRARRARVQELLEAVELSGYEKRMPATLSGGEAQRAALARALAGSPRIVLLDEPLGPLDADLRAALLGRLSQLHEQFGWTALHVTHDPSESRDLATREVRIESGRLVEGSDPR